MTPITTSIERLQTLLPQLFAPSKVSGDLFLRVELAADVTVGFSLDLVEEVQTISVGQITPIPNMNEEVLGLVQARGYIFWLVDLSQLLRFQPLQNRRRQYEMIMMSLPSSAVTSSSTGDVLMAKQFLGFAVQKIKGTFRALPEDISTPDSNISDRFGSHVHGQVNTHGEVIPLLTI